MGGRQKYRRMTGDIRTFIHLGLLGWRTGRHFGRFFVLFPVAAGIFIAQIYIGTGFHQDENGQCCKNNKPNQNFNHADPFL